MEKSLLEYAATDVNRNRMSKFLKGIQPKDFFFIGLTDHYDKDLDQLAKMLNWDAYKSRTQNITGNKPFVDEDTIEKIKNLNREDYDLYSEALQIREERIMEIK